MALGRKNGNWRGGKLLGTCENCDREFRYYACDVTGKYCSRNCFRQALVGKSHGHRTSNEHTPWNKGIKVPSMSGENHPHWIADRTKLVKRDARNDSAYKGWRYSVLKRDDWRCRACGIQDYAKIQADHIYGWTKFPRLRYMVENGQALCRECHKTKTALELRGVNTVSIY